jgi:hypothetical protein
MQHVLYKCLFYELQSVNILQDVSFLILLEYKK